MSDDTRRSIQTRRRVLAGTGTVATLALAGCLGDDDTDDGTPDEDESAPDEEGTTPEDDDGEETDDGTEQAEEFVTLLAESVGDEHDHDYAHDGLTPDEIDHACGHLEFDDGEPLTSAAAHGDAPIIDDTHQPYEVSVTDGAGYVAFEFDIDDDHADVSTFDIIDRDHDEVVADLHGDHWHGELPHVHEGEHISLGAHIEDGHGEEIDLDGDHYELRVDHADHDSEDIVSFDFHGDHVHIIGEEEGHADVVFQLYHDDHVEFETPPIHVDVEHDHNGENDDHHADIGKFDIIDRNTDEVVADLHDDHWDGALPHVHEGEHISLGADIEDGDGEHIHLDGDHYELRVDYADHDSEDIVSFDFHGDHVHIIGEEEGHADVVFQLYHDDHVEFETPPIEVEVEHYHDDHDEHGHTDMFGIFIEGGHLAVETGDLVYEEPDDVAACDPMDRYVIVEPDHGEIVVEVTT